MVNPCSVKEGRGLIPTEAGEVILSYARRILDLNDDAITSFQGAAVKGTIRFGVPSDLAETWLPKILGRFKRANPEVFIEAIVDRNALLLDALDKGRLDLALAFGGDKRADTNLLASLPMSWIGAASAEPFSKAGETLPLVMYGPPCFFRQVGIGALDKAGITWRMSFTSSSLHGLWAAVDAGLGVTLRTTLGLPRSLMVLDETTGLPSVPAIGLALHDAKRNLSPAAQKLKTILVETISGNFFPSNLGTVAGA